MLPVDICSAIVRERGYLAIGSNQPIPIGTVLTKNNCTDTSIQPVCVIELTTREDFEVQVRFIQTMLQFQWPISPVWSYFYRVATD